MRYQEAINYLYEKLPMFQRIGPPAFKKDLTNTLKLCERLGNPQQAFKAIHIAGTNGKGSSSHMIAAILQQAGLKVGLYTSPHLKSFTERIKINGLAIPEKHVVEFVKKYIPLLEEINPSFFEVTVVMAFEYFAREAVDIAVFEVGLGGRLDSTNVLIPEISLITNISYDHQDMLGDTLEKIAGEKAGIIKKGIPVVIGSSQEEIVHVFHEKAYQHGSLIDIATDYYEVDEPSFTNRHLSCRIRSIHSGTSLVLKIGASGLYQLKNLPGVMRVIDILIEKRMPVLLDHIITGLENFQEITGLKGRWQVLSENPLTITDVAHNEAGIKEILEQLLSMPVNRYHFVLGFVKEKDIHSILPLFPQTASYYFCQADVPRAMDARILAYEAGLSGLKGRIIPDVNEALQEARKQSHKNDIIFIGGSTFVVSEIDTL